MLIKCEECNKEVSDRASTCPNCGNPISSKSRDVMVHFGIRGGQIIYSDCYIYSKSRDNILAEGKQGQTLSFECNSPTEIAVRVKGGSKDSPSIIANPGDRFNVVYSFWGNLSLEKVDMIMSGTNPNKF